MVICADVAFLRFSLLRLFFAIIRAGFLELAAAFSLRALHRASFSSWLSLVRLRLRAAFPPVPPVPPLGIIESRESSRLRITVAEFEREWVINLHPFETVVNRNVNGW